MATSAASQAVKIMVFSETDREEKKVFRVNPALCPILRSTTAPTAVPEEVPQILAQYFLTMYDPSAEEVSIETHELLKVDGETDAVERPIQSVHDLFSGARFMVAAKKAPAAVAVGVGGDMQENAAAEAVVSTEQEVPVEVVAANIEGAATEQLTAVSSSSTEPPVPPSAPPATVNNNVPVAPVSVAPVTAPPQHVAPNVQPVPMAGANIPSLAVPVATAVPSASTAAPLPPSHTTVPAVPATAVPLPTFHEPASQQQYTANVAAPAAAAPLHAAPPAPPANANDDELHKKMPRMEQHPQGHQQEFVGHQQPHAAALPPAPPAAHYPQQHSVPPPPPQQVAPQPHHHHYAVQEQHVHQSAVPPPPPPQHHHHHHHAPHGDLPPPPSYQQSVAAHQPPSAPVHQHAAAPPPPQHDHRVDDDGGYTYSLSSSRYRFALSGHTDADRPRTPPPHPSVVDAPPPAHIEPLETHIPLVGLLQSYCQKQPQQPLTAVEGRAVIAATMHKVWMHGSHQHGESREVKAAVTTCIDQAHQEGILEEYLATRGNLIHYRIGSKLRTVLEITVRLVTQTLADYMRPTQPAIPMWKLFEELRERKNNVFLNTATNRIILTNYLLYKQIIDIQPKTESGNMTPRRLITSLDLADWDETKDDRMVFLCDAVKHMDGAELLAYNWLEAASTIDPFALRGAVGEVHLPAAEERHVDPRPRMDATHHHSHHRPDPHYVNGAAPHPDHHRHTDEYQRERRREHSLHRRDDRREHHEPASGGRYTYNTSSNRYGAGATAGRAAGEDRHATHDNTKLQGRQKNQCGKCNAILPPNVSFPEHNRVCAVQRQLHQEKAAGQHTHTQHSDSGRQEEHDTLRARRYRERSAHHGAPPPPPPPHGETQPHGAPARRPHKKFQCEKCLQYLDPGVSFPDHNKYHCPKRPSAADSRRR